MVGKQVLNPKTHSEDVLDKYIEGVASDVKKEIPFGVLEGLPELPTPEKAFDGSKLSMPKLDETLRRR